MLILLRYDDGDNWHIVHKISRSQNMDFNRENIEGILEKWIDQKFVIRKTRRL
ncbi:hypothetical protein QUF72_14790 [Desulfobacterales bacterium HSG2]|nr:hypothetical protein [Desulfobacterales bacterium HSG2]